MAAQQISDKDIKKATQQLKEIRAFLKELEGAGIEVPPALKKSLNRLQVALDTAEDLGAVCGLGPGQVRDAVDVDGGRPEPEGRDVVGRQAQAVGVCAQVPEHDSGRGPGAAPRAA